MKNRYKYTAELHKVSKRFNDSNRSRLVLDEVSMFTERGSLNLLLGPSGSGKTTLLTIMAGLQGPSSGDAILFGRNITEYSSSELQQLRAQSIGFIFQTFKLIDSLSVLQNLMVVNRFAGRDIVSARSASMEYLERLGVEHLAGSRPGKLSQGEKQRVAVARALVNGAELIIADEPTGSLSSSQGMSIISFLREVADNEKRTIVVASHDERIRDYSSRIYYLSDGRLDEYQ